MFGLAFLPSPVLASTPTGYVVRADYSVPAGAGFTQYTATCNSGDFATGGGWSENIGLNTIESLPTVGGVIASNGATPNGWIVTTSNPTDYALAISVLVDCMHGASVNGYVSRATYLVPASTPPPASYTATCNSGDFATGGGWSENIGLNTIESFPTVGGSIASNGATPNGWMATTSNPTDSALVIDVMADCLSGSAASGYAARGDYIVPASTPPPVHYTATCNSGDFATGGGWSENIGLNTIESLPTVGGSIASNGATPNGWTATTSNPTGSGLAISVLSDCISTVTIPTPQFSSLPLVIGIGAAVVLLASRRALGRTKLIPA